MSKRDRLILLTLMGGFLMLALEARYLHRNVLNEEWQSVILPVFALLAVVACAFGLIASRLGRWVCSLFMLVGIGVGVYGAWLHSEGEVEPLTRLLTASITARADGGEDEAREEAESEDEPPVLAPLSLSGLSAVGLIVAFPAGFRKA
ncbi:MAG: hypothetical protein C4341_03505 [Armatimonadota bacterium]